MRPLKSYSAYSEKLHFLMGIDSNGRVYLRYEKESPGHVSFAKFFRELLDLTYKQI
jgi:hypothetical protein